MPLTLMYITNNPQVALIAEKNGVDRIWVDLETLGKEERQHNMNTVKSNHCIGDIRKIKPLLKSSKMLVRVNPWNENSVEEIDEVVLAGADMIMLPMWKTPGEVSSFLNAVNGRCKTILLLETKEAVECLDEVLLNGGMDEMYIGLNDLHLSYNMSFMFEPLANGLVESIIKKIDKLGIPFGFGGVAALGKGDLPAEKVVAEHYRLGSTRAILSRSFCNSDMVSNCDEIEKVFSANVKKLRDFENNVIPDLDLIKNHTEVVEIVGQIVSKKRGNR